MAISSLPIHRFFIIPLISFALFCFYSGHHNGFVSMLMFGNVFKDCSKKKRFQKQFLKTVLIFCHQLKFWKTVYWFILECKRFKYSPYVQLKALEVCSQKAILCQKSIKNMFFRTVIKEGYYNFIPLMFGYISMNRICRGPCQDVWESPVVFQQ